MKKLVLILTFATTAMMAQNQIQEPVPQISVSGEGKIKVVPDQAVITLGVENTGKDATEVKKKNDETVDAIIKAIKKNGIPTSDYQTQNVSLRKNYDYNQKKYSYYANQTISIHLKDLKKYDALLMSLVDAGVNNIQGVEFKSSRLEQYESEARVKAMLDAKKKAEDYVSVLGQKVGKALQISDNSQVNYPRPMYKTYAVAEMADAAPRETLAIGEIEVTANVSVSFELK
ncbi:SIMPL domain-containing protein [Flavobacterium sp. NRK F10]|uniref:SIMPL domain-containing protein n=1 Tax=Flavobacterium sp. NRK F10 TaxID=2954931 RepID=UPI002090590C|nr:SIMPL domain-containing protein [Flavobacterium sp. NRK F10]MCO6173672.1 SIMPL domain-containing protein [Flavobacterium sp. NRK F10]